MTGDPMVSIFFFFNTNDRFYVLINIVKNLTLINFLDTIFSN